MSRDSDRSESALLDYADTPQFRDSNTWEMVGNPFRRSLRPQSLGCIDFSVPRLGSQFMDYESLAAQRVLTTVYEQDLVFLPKESRKGWKLDFDQFYSIRLRGLANQFRTDLENYVFGHLEDTISVSRSWTGNDLKTLLTELNSTQDVPGVWEQSIRNSSDPQRAAKMWLIQLAPDFLSESSPMMKNVLGNYGPVQSEWFKILIDEYGYGVHEKKHSTLYEETLKSVELSAEPHTYWQYYLSSALAANNLFHYLGSEHRNFFRYAGALAVTELTLVDFCRRASVLLSEVFDGQCDTEYFDEHIHIDGHHGKMAYEDVCVRLIDDLGEEVVPDMVWGVLAYRYLSEQFDRQFASQIEWMDGQDHMMDLHDKIIDQVKEDGAVPMVELNEHYNELSNSHSHNKDELCHIVSGEMYFFSGFDSYRILGPGDGVVIRGRRQHGADIVSDNCEYRIYTIGEVETWL